MKQQTQTHRPAPQRETATKRPAQRCPMGDREERSGMGLAQRRAEANPAVRHAAQLQAQLDGSSRVKSTAQRVVQREGGDGDDNSFFKKYIFGPHFYKVRHQANSPLDGESEAETTSRTFQSLKKKPAPFNFGRSATKKGNPFFIFPFGWINSQSNSEDSSVTNTTLFPHFFHPGYVKRTAIGSDIETEGGGTGLFPAVNNYFANWLWGNQAFRLRLKNDPKFKKQWDQQTIEEFDQLPKD